MSNLAKVIAPGAATSTVAAAQSVGATGAIEVDITLYSAIAVMLSLMGVLMARLVTISEENKRLGRKQTWGETGPLTWVGVLIVCPLIWHFKIAIPYASLIGLGVGYTVQVILRILGGTSVNAARVIAERTLASLKVGATDGLRQGPPVHTPNPAVDKALNDLDEAEEQDRIDRDKLG